MEAPERELRPFVFSLDRKQGPRPIGPPLFSRRRSAAAVSAAAGSIKSILDGSSMESCIHGPSCSLRQKCQGAKAAPRHLQSMEIYKVLQPATVTRQVPTNATSYTKSSQSESMTSGSLDTAALESRYPLPEAAPAPPRRVLRHVVGQQHQHLCNSDFVAFCPSTSALPSCPSLDAPEMPPHLTFSRQQYLRGLNSDIFWPGPLPVSRKRVT